MDLLNFLVGSNKTVDPCFLCLKNDKINLDIHTIFEIRNKCEIISISLADMFKNLFPNEEFVFMQTCNNCLNLISELYILLHKRKSKILLLDFIMTQLMKNTKLPDNVPLVGDKFMLNVQIPLYQGLYNKYLIPSHAKHHYKTISKDVCHINDSNEQILNLHTDQNVQKIKGCQYCPGLFQGMEELTSHLKIHRKKRHRRPIYHYCTECNYKSLSKTTLQAHINKNHLNTRPHICQICYKGFFNRSNLNEHIKTHNTVRNQICELCGSSFIHKKSLNEHLRLHSDTRPYECHICHKNFITSGRRSDHIKRSHMEKNECCVICNKKYSLKKELTRHMNNVHLRHM